MAARVVCTVPISFYSNGGIKAETEIKSRPSFFKPPSPCNSISLHKSRKLHPLSLEHRQQSMLACIPSQSSHSTSSSDIDAPTSSTRPGRKLYVSGLSFRTTEDSLRNAFQNFGQLVEVNLVMDKIANRPRGFAFVHYATDEESQRAIEGMHGKFLDGRVIFVEVAKPRPELRPRKNPR